MKENGKYIEVSTNLEVEGMVVERRWGKPEERFLAVRLRTNWSHCVNLNAGPAVKSPNIYKACIAQFPHSPNNPKKLQTLNLYHKPMQLHLQFKKCHNLEIKIYKKRKKN